MATIQDLVREASDLADWQNQSIPGYLKTLGAWLGDSDGYYANRHQVPPSNSWETLKQALQGARSTNDRMCGRRGHATLPR